MNRVKATFYGVVIGIAALGLALYPSRHDSANAQGGPVVPISTYSRALLALTTQDSWQTALGIPNTITAIFTAGTTDFRSQIQTQWDAAAAAGKALLLPPGTYPCTTTGSGSAKHCLQPGTTTLNYRLLLAPGAVLKIANSQGVDGASCKLIRFVDHTGGLYVGWPFGGKGGTLSGNTANQSGWTTASGENGTRYGQVRGYHAIAGDDTNGSGSRDITIENILIDDFFSNNLVIGYTTGGVYGAGTQRVYARGIKTTNCGEGMVFACVDFFGMENCEDVRALNKMQGDSFEPSFCRYGFVRNCLAHTNGVTNVAGGAGVDAYCSRHVVISDIQAFGTPNAITLESDFNGNPSAQTGYCDDIVVTNVIADRLTLSELGLGIIPSQSGRSTFSNCTIKNYSSQGLYLVSQTQADGTTVDFSMSNCVFTNCGNAIIDSTSGDIKAQISNTRIKTNTATNDYALIYTRSSGTKAMDFTLTGGCLEGGATAQLQITGSGTFQPTGRIAGVNYVTTGGQTKLALGATTDLRNMLIDDTGVLKMISQTASFTHHGTNIVYWNNTPGALTTLNPGTPFQRLTISFMFEGGTVNDKTVTGGAANIRLAGAANKTFSRYDLLDLVWDNQNTEWVERSRSLNH